MSTLHVYFKFWEGTSAKKIQLPVLLFLVVLDQYSTLSEKIFLSQVFLF